MSELRRVSDDVSPLRVRLSSWLCSALGHVESWKWLLECMTI